jgi:hypothetical protein
MITSPTPQLAHTLYYCFIHQLCFLSDHCWHHTVELPRSFCVCCGLSLLYCTGQCAVGAHNEWLHYYSAKSCETKQTLPSYSHLLQYNALGHGGSSQRVSLHCCHRVCLVVVLFCSTDIALAFRLHSPRLQGIAFKLLIKETLTIGDQRVVQPAIATTNFLALYWHISYRSIQC